MAGSAAEPAGHELGGDEVGGHKPAATSFDDLHHDQVAQTLLQAASDVLAAEGVAALTVRRIAAVAGVSTMNVYSRFGSKDGIVEHLYIEGFSRLRDAQDVGETDDPVDDLRRCGAGYRRFALDNPTYYAVMFGGAIQNFHPSEAALLHAGGTLQMLADRLARAMDVGALATGDPMRTAAAVWAACHGVVSLEMNDVGPPTLDWEKVYATTTNALMAGLAAPAPDSTRLKPTPQKAARGPAG